MSWNFQKTVSSLCFDELICLYCSVSMSWYVRKIYIATFEDYPVLMSWFVLKKIHASVWYCGIDSHLVSELLYRADSEFAPSQWEMSLQSNTISHWLGANLESALWYQAVCQECLLAGCLSCWYKWFIKSSMSCSVTSNTIPTCQMVCQLSSTINLASLLN